MRKAWLAAALAAVGARAHATPASYYTDRDRDRKQTLEPAAPPAAVPVEDGKWFAVPMKDKSGGSRPLIFNSKQRRGIAGDGGFDYEFPLFRPEVKGDQVVAHPSKYLLWIKSSSYEAIVFSDDPKKPLITFTKFDKVRVPIDQALTLKPGYKVVSPEPAAPAPPAVAAGDLSAYEKHVRLALLSDPERAECGKDTAACRKKLADLLAVYAKQHLQNGKVVEGDLDEWETRYLKERLGQEGFATFEKDREQAKKDKKEAEFNAKWRQAIVTEAEGYVKKPGSEYDPAGTNTSVASKLSKAPAGAHRRVPVTPLEDAVWWMMRGPEQDMERAMLAKYYGNPSNKAGADRILELAKKKPLSPQDVAEFNALRKTARDAMREQLLKPDASSPFHGVREQDLLEAYCDEDVLAAPAPTPAAAPKEGKGMPTADKLREAAEKAKSGTPETDAVGTTYDGNRQTANPLAEKCKPIVEKKVKLRNRPPRDYTDRSDYTGPTTLPSAPPVDPKNQGEIKPDANANINWITGAKFAIVALVAVGILTGGVGLVAIAAAGAAFGVGYFLSKENNR